MRRNKECGGTIGKGYKGSHEHIRASVAASSVSERLLHHIVPAAAMPLVENAGARVLECGTTYGKLLPEQG